MKHSDAKTSRLLTVLVVFYTSTVLNINIEPLNILFFCLFNTSRSNWIFHLHHSAVADIVLIYQYFPTVIIVIKTNRTVLMFFHPLFIINSTSYVRFDILEK